jgi:hypothetical protein
LNEDLEYIAVQKKDAINLSPGFIALTNKRIISCKPKKLGLSMEFQDYLWKDVAVFHVKEKRLFKNSLFFLCLRISVRKQDFIPIRL